MNAILIIVDSMQKQMIGAYGNDWIKTPNLDKLASESAVFTNAYAESLPTLQARRSIHTGIRVYPWEFVAARKGDERLNMQPGWGPIPEEQTTLAEILRGRGYSTALFTDAYHQFKPGKNFHRGFLEWHWIRGQECDPLRTAVTPGYRDMDDFLIYPGSKKSRKAWRLRQWVHDTYFKNTADRKSEEDYFAPRVFRAAAGWLEENHRSGPFLLVVDSFDPHEPWDPPEWYRKLYDPDDDMKQDVINSNYGRADVFSERELHRMRANYAGETTMVDKWMGRFLDKAGQLGVLEDTVVIFTSDHGHLVGEYNLAGKFMYPAFPETVEVPIMVRHPKGVGRGEKIDCYAAHHDIAPTILSALGEEPFKEMEGEDLWQVITGKGRIARDHWTVGWNGYIVVVNEDYFLNIHVDGTQAKLYDLRKKRPFEKNVAASKRAVVKDLWKTGLADARGPIPKYVYETPRAKDPRGIS